MKLVVVICRIMTLGRSALAIVARFVMGMTVRGDLLDHICGHHGDRFMGRRTVGQDHNKGSNNQRKDNDQRYHAACRVPCPVMEGLVAHAQRSLVLLKLHLVISSLGGY